MVDLGLLEFSPLPDGTEGVRISDKFISHINMLNDRLVPGRFTDDAVTLAGVYSFCGYRLQKGDKVEYLVEAVLKVRDLTDPRPKKRKTRRKR
jgi:hypothetical protein